METGRRWLLAALAFVPVVAAASCGGSGDPATFDLSAERVATRGAEIFAVNCASCHGPDLQGTATGPPLLHDFYKPSHHGDAAFLLAVTRGVQPHHWDFGPMPAIPSMSEEDIALVTAFVRSVQADAGLIEAP